MNGERLGASKAIKAHFKRSMIHDQSFSAQAAAGCWGKRRDSPVLVPLLLAGSGKETPKKALKMSLIISSKYIGIHMHVFYTHAGS